LLVYGSSKPDWDDVVFSTGIDAAIVDKIKDSTLTPRFDQKYIENTFDGTPLILKVHPITLEGKRVADLLEITGFDKDKASFTFQSRITNPDIFAGNKSSTMVNTAALFSGSTRLNMASGSVTFVSKTLAKEMLKRGHLDDPAAGVNDYTTSAGEGFDYKDKSVIFRLSINADGVDFTGMEDAAGNILGKATVTDTLPAGWEFVDIVSGSAYLIFKGEKSGNTVKATGAPLDPGTLTGFKAAFNAAERKATFTFDALDQPYVILLKAKPDNDALAGYFDGNKTTTRRNDLSLKTENWTPGVSTHRDVTIVSRILDKTLETPEDGVLEDGELKWIVEYRPYDLPGGGTRLIDKLPEGLELRTDSGGALLLDGNITAHELTLNSDGSYSEGDEVTLIIGENITYNNAERELTFYIPDQSKAYRFTYLTDITGESGELTNRVVLCGKTEEQEKKSESYVITERDGWATMLRNGWIEIKKVDGSTGEFLKGAEFTLYSSDGETVLRKGFTGADGTLKFKVIPDGEYILKETAVPDGYSLESVSHFLIVTTTGDEVVASIDGREGEGSNLITIYNHLEGTVGNLTIKKTVAGNGADETKAFEFTVSFKLPPGTAPDTLYSYVGEGVPGGQIKSGDTLSLAHGQSITITGLPKGTEYTVSEGDYRLEGYVTAADGDETGTIVADETAEVNYTNTRNVGSLTISKTVAGNAGDEEKEFEFTVTFDPPEGMSSTYPYTGFGLPDGTITSGDTLSLVHGQSITITDLPAGTGYTVSEGDYRLEGYVTAADGDETGIIVTDETEEVNYTNTRNVGSLTVSKTVAGNAGDEEKEFAFILTFDPSEGMPDSYPYSGEGISAGAVITSGDTITLAHGQSITITEIPEGTEYGVTEVDYTDEGYVTTAAGTTGVITAGDDDDGLPEYFAEFTNTRNEGHLVIRKTVAGALGDKERPFTFVVYFEASGGYRYWGSKTGTIESGQAITLKHGEHIVIEGLLAGTSYRVTEVEANQEGYCTTYTGIVGEITTSGRTADFVNTKIDLPRTGAGGLNTIWGMLLLSSLFLLFTAGGLFLVFPDRRSGQ
ncbi:MAG: hypothetical protein GX878_06835, partial [Firmicutes bacterium]|nr:hypothetical protein [Bacillota bacterium]